MTTIGELVSILFSKYQRQFHDERLAALATQITLDELLRESKPAGKRKAV